MSDNTNLYTTGWPTTVNITRSTTSTDSVAVGLTVFFVLLVLVGVAVAALVAYRRRRTFGNALRAVRRGQERVIDKDRTTQDDTNTYTSLSREQPIAQTPIYENIKRQPTEHSIPVLNSRSPGQPEEDLYLQCYLDEPIYSNDPACTLSVLPDARDEDVYLVPDSV